MKKNIYLGLTLDTKTAWLFYTPFNFETLNLFNGRYGEDYKFSQDDFTCDCVCAVTEWKYEKEFKLSAVAMAGRYFKLLKNFEINQKFNVYYNEGSCCEIAYIYEIEEISKARYEKILSEKKPESKKYAFDTKTAFNLRSIYYDYYLDKFKPLEKWALEDLKNFCALCLCHAPSDYVPFDCPFTYSGICLQSLSFAAMLSKDKSFMEKLLKFDEIIRQQLNEENNFI